MSGEEEGFAFVHNDLHVETESGIVVDLFLLLHLIEKHPQKVVAVGAAPADLHAVLSSLYDLH